MKALFAALLFLPSLLWAETAVWKVSKGSQLLYIAGSVHVMRESAYPLPAAFDLAWKFSDLAVFETDLVATSDPAFGPMMMEPFINRPGVKGADLVKPEIWQKLQAFCTERQLPLANFNSFHPALTLVILTVMELQRLGISPEHGVDMHYLNRAIAENRPLAALETPEQQITYLASMKEVDVNHLVGTMLADLIRTSASMDDLIQLWRNGDMDGLFSLVGQAMQDVPEVYDTLVVQRNKRWVPQLQAMLETDPIEFVMVGALHLAGPDSVLKQLEALGYDVAQR